MVVRGEYADPKAEDVFIAKLLYTPKLKDSTSTVKVLFYEFLFEKGSICIYKLMQMDEKESTMELTAKMIIGCPEFHISKFKSGAVSFSSYCLIFLHF